jgi:hypothetical protein
MDIIFNFKEWFLSFKKEKNIIIDPISCLVKLSILSLYPKGTKMSISNTGLNFNNSNIFQGSIRFIQGDCREDLHNLFKPLQKSIDWYWNTPKYQQSLDDLFIMSELGLLNLKNCYSSNSIIQHSIDHYILYIHNRNDNKQIIEQTDKKKQKNPRTNSTNSTNTDDDVTQEFDKNIIYNFLKQLWSQREINIIIELFNEYKEPNKIQEEKENIIIIINNLTSVKEKILAGFIKDNCSSL